jgi:peptide/nickel transport system permease protein
MPVQPVLLWTDLLLWLVVAVAAGIALWVRSQPHLRAPWRKVFRRPLAVAASVLLGGYLIVALLDSLHFHPPLEGAAPGEAQWAPEVLSMLDVILTPLRESTEKTYSAPFATHLHMREAITLADGTEVRDYPRLAHGGAHLEGPGDRATDLALRGLGGLAAGMAAWALLVLAWAALAGRRRGGGPRGALRDLARAPSHGPGRVAFGTLLLVVAGVAVLAAWAPHYHVLGTDKVGQDVLYKAVKSIRTGVVIGTLTTLVMLPFALALGVAAGYFRGWVDDAVQYLYTTLSSIPGVLLIAAAILTVQVYMAAHAAQWDNVAERADLRLLALCAILGITSWTTLARLLRGEALKLRGMEYVQAAQAFGVRHPVILGRHILPNVMHVVLITLVLDFSALVLAEAVLSYINIGVDPTTHSWGNMINAARLELAREPVVWWSLTAAFAFMFVLVLAANVLADAVRDAFDPRTEASP